MDLRMLKDYLRIFWKSWLGVTISYAAICGLVADRDYPVTFFLWLAFLSLGSFVWIHFFHFQGWRSSGLLFALPISRRQLAHTVWFEVIGISTIAASFVFAAQWLALGLSFHPWTLKIGHLFLPFVFTGLLLTNGYWFFLAAFEKSRHAPLSSILSITVFIGYCYCSFMLLRYWPTSNIMSVLLILCGLFITIFSFIYSELVLGLILNPSRIPAHINHGKVEKKHCESSSRINCWWAHPARIVVSETWLMIIVPYALLALAKGLLPANAITRSDILPLIMCCVTSIAALVMFVLGPTLDALRLWATTPVSRTTMAVTFITLPFIALFPVVVILMVESRLSFFLYLVFTAAWLVVTCGAMRWGRSGAIIMLNIVMVLLNFWPIFRLKMSKSAEIIDCIGLTLFITVTAMASFWIIHLLRTRTEPFRYHLTVFRKMPSSR